MERGIPYLDDSNMEELPNEIIEKLRNMIDEEFADLEFMAAK